jgi:hypothetical protein
VVLRDEPLDEAGSMSEAADTRKIGTKAMAK